MGELGDERLRLLRCAGNLDSLAVVQHLDADGKVLTEQVLLGRPGDGTWSLTGATLACRLARYDGELEVSFAFDPTLRRWSPLPRRGPSMRADVFLVSRGPALVASLVGFALLLALGRRRVVTRGRVLSVAVLALPLAAPGFGLIADDLSPSSAETNALAVVFGLMLGVVLYVPTLGLSFFVANVGKHLTGRYAWVAAACHLGFVTAVVYAVDRASLESSFKARVYGPDNQPRRFTRPDIPPAPAPVPAQVEALRPPHEGVPGSPPPSPSEPPARPSPASEVSAGLVERLIDGRARVDRFVALDSQAAGTANDDCALSESAAVGMVVAEGDSELEYRVPSCGQLGAELRAKCKPSVLRAPPFVVEVGHGWVRRGTTTLVDGLEETCSKVSAGMRAKSWCKTDFSSTHYRVLSMVGPLLSLSKRVTEAGGGGAPASEESWQTVDVRSGQPAVLVEWVDEASLVAAAQAEIALAADLQPDDAAGLRLAKTWRQVHEVLGLKHPEAFAFGSFDPALDLVALRLPLSASVPRFVGVQSVELKVRPAKALRPFLRQALYLAEPQPLHCEGVVSR